MWFPTCRHREPSKGSAAGGHIGSEPDFINYTLVTTDGKLVTGFILSETAVGVTLRRAGEADDTVLRSQIKELRADGKSLMPEGLEQGLTQQDMTDLLSFLQKPEGGLLSEVK